MSVIKYRLRTRNINIVKNDVNAKSAAAIEKPAKRANVKRSQNTRVIVSSTRSNGQATVGNVRKRQLTSISVEQQVSEEEPPSKRKFELVVDPRFSYDRMNAKKLVNVSNLASEIFQIMRHREKRYQLSTTPASSQITESQRAIVVDWLIECQEFYHYTHESLYIAVRLLDIYLVYNPHIRLSRLQLLGGTCFLVAGKYEEHRSIRILHIMELCANAYSRNDFLVMEMEVIRAAHCDLGFPLSYSFLRRFAHVIQTNISTLTLARFVLESSLYYYEFALERPSKVAAAALILALQKTGSTQDWILCLEYHSGYLISQLEPLVQQLDTKICQFKVNFPRCTVVVDKYSDINFHEVAKKFFP